LSYEKLCTLGSGGYGTVILAREIISKRLVAIKKLKVEEVARQNEIIRETRMLSSFSHTNIVIYYHAFEEQGLINLVMEYCPNGSLKSKIESRPLAIEDALSITIKIAKAMEVVHQKGIIHHDIKPANLLLDADNNIKIGDFGIANQGGGTVAYLAPEYFLGNYSKIDGRKLDIYALGVTFLEMLIGKYPFHELGKEDILSIEALNSLVGQFPLWLKDIIIGAIHPYPEKRFPSMKLFYQQLEQRNIPNIITKKVIEAGKLSTEIERLIKNKRWGEAEGKIKYGITNVATHPKLLYQAGRFFMKKNNLAKAKSFFEVIKKKTTLINLDKELGWIALQENKYSEAISYFSDFIQLNPNDIEAYNLLLECSYRSGQYDTGYELGSIFRSNFPNQVCFKLNVALFLLLLNEGNLGKISFFNDIEYNPIFQYNQSVLGEKKPTWDKNGRPALKSKLLFCDYILINGAKRNPFIEILIDGVPEDVADYPIIPIGKKGYESNTIQLDGSKISRRHCLIFNTLKNVWIYDLNSYYGTFVNGTRVEGKFMIYGKVNIKVGDKEIVVNTDRRKLL
jgi:serine/threonine protein kinase